MSGKLFLVGVGPGSRQYMTDIAKKVLRKSRYVIGYSYTLSTIKHLLNFNSQNIIEVTMNNQDVAYKEIYNRMNPNEFCSVPFTGDVNFSESEVVDRLLEIFGNDNVELVPGISSIQVAASKAKIPLDKSSIITFHVTEDIEQKKVDLLDSIRSKRNAIILPRPWPNDKEKEFMESDIALFLKNSGIDTCKLKTWVFEFLTKKYEKVFRGNVSDLEGRQFDALSVMVIDQVKRKTYLEFN
jgi:precorrin-6y C5,15-methyltransferase (decarboxylating) CbiE subunit